MSDVGGWVGERESGYLEHLSEGTRFISVKL